MLRLEWIVRVLAQPASVQRALFPDFVGAGEEMALEFDEHLRAWRERGIDLPPSAAQPLADLDAQLTAMSDLRRDELWFDDDVLASAPEWDAVRALAKRLVHAMGWSSEPPPPRRDALYVGPPD